jgi:hypothetical protein
MMYEMLILPVASIVDQLWSQHARERTFLCPLETALFPKPYSLEYGKNHRRVREAVFRKNKALKGPRVGDTQLAVGQAFMSKQVRRRARSTMCARFILLISYAKTGEGICLEWWFPRACR